MYLHIYLKRRNIWGSGVFRGNPWGFLSSVMQAQNEKGGLQISLESTLWKKLPVGTPHDPEFGQERMKQPLKEALCLCDPVLRAIEIAQTACAVSELLQPQGTWESSWTPLKSTTPHLPLMCRQLRSTVCCCSVGSGTDHSILTEYIEKKNPLIM